MIVETADAPRERRRTPRAATRPHRMAAPERWEPPSDGSPDPSQTVTGQVSPEEWRRFKHELHQASFDAHERDVRDPSWAAPTEATIVRELNAIDGGRFDVDRVDCRTTSCLATVRWENYDQAVQDYPSILHGYFTVGCGRRVLLPEPADRNAEYSVRVIFDCEEARVEQFTNP